MLVKAREKKRTTTNLEKAKRLSLRDKLWLPIQENPVVRFCSFRFHLNVEKEWAYFSALMWANLYTGLQNSQHRATNKKDCMSAELVRVVLPSDFVSGVLHVFSRICLSHCRVCLRAECRGSKQYPPEPISKWGMEIVISQKDGISVTRVTSSRTMLPLIYSNKATAFSEHDIYYYLFAKHDNLRAMERRLGYRLNQTWFIKNTADISTDLWYSFPSH